MSEQYKTCLRCNGVHLVNKSCGGRSKPGVVEELQARIADLQRELDAANEQLAEWQVIGSWKETALKAMADLDAERERANNIDVQAIEDRLAKLYMELETERERAIEYKKAHEAIAATTPTVTRLQADLATERQARQQAEGERDVMRRSSEHNYEACVRAMARLADAVGLLRRGRPFWADTFLDADIRAFLDRVDASAEAPAD